MTELYRFQELVAELLLSGRNVILQAPTGAGKTRAALTPLARSIARNLHDFPQKCIYAVPIRILAKQFHEEWKARVEAEGAQEKLSVKVLTGEQRGDPEFSAGLTFATIDQVLSSYLLTPYSLGRRLANLNAGAVASSYLVFDEFHLLDPVSTLPTTLEMLRQLNDIAPFLLMTATFSSDMLVRLADKLDATIVPEDENSRDEMLTLASQNKTRGYATSENVLTANEILDWHDGKRTLVICNTVDRARHLYEELIKRHPLESTTLLHSRFLQKDRNEHEDCIREVYAQDAPADVNHIVIATQAIEVGLDITSNMLLTELAPANAIIQRAGRCARYEGETGKVIVYRQAFNPKDDEVIDLTKNFMPYQGQEQEIGLTWEAFSECSDQLLTFADEQVILSKVHGERDREIIEGIGVTSRQHRQEMVKVMRGESSGASRLIRNIRAFNVTIHSDYKALIENPRSVETFSLPDVVMWGAMRPLLVQAETWDNDDDPLVALIEKQDSNHYDEENRTAYKPRFINSQRDIEGAVLIVIHPELATYDERLGLLLDPRPDLDRWEGEVFKKTETSPIPDSGYKYRLESYQEHIAWVYKAAFDPGGSWDEVKHAAHRMERLFSWEPGIIERAAKLAVLLHDVGKLSVGWQRWAGAWQEAQGNPMAEGFATAHTDYDSSDPAQREQSRRIKPTRPPHAAEGAFAILPLLADRLDQHPQLVPAVCSAVLRHHTPFAESLGKPFQLIENADYFVAQTLGSNFLPDGSLITTLTPTTDQMEFIVDPTQEEAYLAYTLLVRVLRRADQIGTKIGVGL